MSKAVLDRKVAAERDPAVDANVSARNAQLQTSGSKHNIRDQSEASEPDHEQVERLAYALWEQGGRCEGKSQDDWFQAEKLLKRHHRTNQ